MIENLRCTPLHRRVKISLCLETWWEPYLNAASGEVCIKNKGMEIIQKFLDLCRENKRVLTILLFHSKVVPGPSEMSNFYIDFQLSESSKPLREFYRDIVRVRGLYVQRVNLSWLYPYERKIYEYNKTKMENISTSR